MGVDLEHSTHPAKEEDEHLHSDVSTVDGGATDLSKVTDCTDRTHWSLPEDGSPISIPIRGLGDAATTVSQASQTSLLIEYFEGSTNPRPSVRVKVTPSKKKNRDSDDDRLTITETSKDGRKRIHSQRISLTPTEKGERFIEAYDPRTPTAEAMGVSSAVKSSRDSTYATVGTGERQPSKYDYGTESAISHLDSEPPAALPASVAASDISSMPPDIPQYDSDTAKNTRATKSSRSRALEMLTAGGKLAAGAVGGEAFERVLRAPHKSGSSKTKERSSQSSEHHSRSSDRERRKSSKSRSSSVSKDADLLAETKSPRRRRSSKGVEDEPALEKDAGAYLTPKRHSGDQQSVLSGTSAASKSSINNPRLLSTVEDAIRRLILPELESIKQQQNESKERARQRSERGDAFGSEASMDEGGRRRRRTSKSTNPSEPSNTKVRIVNEGLVGRAMKDRNGERKSSAESVSDRGHRRHRSRDPDDRSHKSSSKDGSRSKTGLAKGVDEDSKSERRRRHRSHSRSDLDVSEGKEDVKRDTLPLPLLGSELNPSEVTRESLLSVNSEKTESPATHSPAEAQEAARELSWTDDDDLAPLAKYSDSAPPEFGYHGGTGNIAAVAARQLREHDVLLNKDGRPLVEGHDYPIAPIRTQPQPLSPIQSVDDSAEEHDVHMPGHHYPPHAQHLEDEDIWTAHKQPQAAAVRDSMEYDDVSSSNGSYVPIRHLTNYTDDSGDPAYFDNLATGQAVKGVGANASIRSTPDAVKSAVASLINPSRLSVNDEQDYESYQSSIAEDMNDPANWTAEKSRNVPALEVPMSAHGIPNPNDPMPDLAGLTIGDDESETSTNPFDIRGPGPTKAIHDGMDPWGYEPTSHHSLDLAGAEHALGKSKDEDYGQPLEPENPLQHNRGFEDEAYFTSNNNGSLGPASGGQLTPDPTAAQQQAWENLMNGPEEMDFETKHARHLSMNSHGMPSPLYDGAMGRGIDRIQSKDIVALMDHLTVRDAQRNARDTEILITLVRSAAEMRTSFDEMKRFMAEHEKNIGDHTEKTVKQAINGPRPPPTTRFAKSSSDSIDEPTKKQNVFKRALKGLSMRSSNDLTKIEDMLNQLLMEVETLKANQSAPGTQQGMRSFDQLQTVSEGYEADAHPGTSSGGPSGFFSTSASGRGSAMRHLSDHRITTVEEADEDDHSSDEEEAVTPRQTRGASEPIHTPPLKGLQPLQPAVFRMEESQSADNTPKRAKHKSASSSFLPKVSRWSETTASTIARGFLGSRQKPRPESTAGDDEADFWARQNPTGDKLHSTYSLEDAGSPITPQTGSPIPHRLRDVDDNPAHRANRISLDIKHPKPVPGTGLQRLESQAEQYVDGASFDRWGSNPSLPQHANRYSTGSQPRPGSLSPVSSVVSQRYAEPGPPLPPKIMEEPLIPQEATPKTFMARATRSVGEGADPVRETISPQNGSRRANSALRDHYGLDLESSNSPTGSPSGSRADMERKGLSPPPPTLHSISAMNAALGSSNVQRRPSGPRAMNSSGSRKKEEVSSSRLGRNTFGSSHDEW